MKAEVKKQPQSVPAKAKREKKVKGSWQAVEPKSATFPAEHKINAYGFIGIHKDWPAATGWHKTCHHPEFNGRWKGVNSPQKGVGDENAKK